MRVTELAYRLHQAFKSEFIAVMPKDGSHIPISDLMAWLDAQKAALAQDGKA